MKNKGSRRLIARLGLALAVAAVLAPGAQAKPTPPDPPDPPSIESGVSVKHQDLLRLKRTMSDRGALIRRSPARPRVPRRAIGGWD